MKDVKVVIGASFGDEGKGLMTDYFAADAANKGETALVVCSNGGAQRGHTVRAYGDNIESGMKPEVRHVFHHFGSGTLAGADMKDGLRINKVKHNRQIVEKVDLNGGGVAFFDSVGGRPEDLEQKVFVDAINKGTDLVVKPEQAMVVTQILEAIYESSKTNKPVYFN